MNLSPANHSADDIVRLLRLAPLSQEGGYFRRTAEATLSSPATRGARPGWSMILALFTPQQFSALHRMASDELWCFHAGDPLELLLLRPDGAEWTRLGPAPGDCLQHVVPAAAWQGARVAAGGHWSLVTCVCTPGFQWNDFELARRDALEREFPGARELIWQMTR